MPLPDQSINFRGKTAENFERASDIIRTCLGSKSGDPVPLYMMFDGTYVAKCLDVVPRGPIHGDKVHIVGRKCEMKGEKDRSLVACDNVNDAAQDTCDQDSLACEVLEFFVHHACQLHHLPCMTVATIAKAWGNNGFPNATGAPPRGFDSVPLIHSGFGSISKHCTRSVTPSAERSAPPWPIGGGLSSLGCLSPWGCLIPWSMIPSAEKGV